MGTVINFPTKGNFVKDSLAPRPPQATSDPAPVVKTKKRISAGGKLKAILLLMTKGLWASIWLTIVCLWPMLRFIAALDLLFQLIRTAYYWNTPNVYAGWTFLLHFAAFTVLTGLVAVHRPAGFRDLPPINLTAKKA